MTNCKACFCVLLIMIPFCSTQVSAEDLNLTIKSSAIELSRELIRIADVANVKADNLADKQAIERLDLDEFKNDKPIEISRKQIEMRIRLAFAKFDRIQVTGPDKIKAQRVSANSRRTRIKALVTKAIVNQFGIDSQDLRLTVQPVVNFDQSKFDLQRLASAQVSLPTELPLGKARIDLAYDDASGNEIRLPLDCRVSVVADMLVATKNLDRGTVLTTNDYKRVRRPINDRRMVPAAVSDLAGKQTSAVIPMHGVIQLANLRPAAKRNLVARNDVVDVKYTQGAINLRIKNAKVVTPGGKGDRVEFINPESQKRLAAIVVSESLLEIR